MAPSIQEFERQRPLEKGDMLKDEFGRTVVVVETGRQSTNSFTTNPIDRILHGKTSPATAVAEIIEGLPADDSIIVPNHHNIWTSVRRINK